MLTITTETITTNDGVRLSAESTGRGRPRLFLHEFAGDHRSWEPQARLFSARQPILITVLSGQIAALVDRDRGRR